ncbi:MAG: hypothetical protein IT569_07195 [Leptospiraceae bacterium]|nr:hypothetical protein [Leptospiraceae bacterium]
MSKNAKYKVVFVILLVFVCKEKAGKITYSKASNNYFLLLSDHKIYRDADSDVVIGVCLSRNIVKSERFAYISKVNSETGRKYSSIMELIECQGVRGWIHNYANIQENKNKEFLEKNIDRIFFIREFSEIIGGVYGYGVYSVYGSDSLDGRFVSSDAVGFQDIFPEIKKLSGGEWEMSNDKTILHVKKVEYGKSDKGLQIKVMRDTSGHYAKLNGKTIIERGQTDTDEDREALKEAKKLYEKK